MIRILFFLLLVFAVGSGLAWLADRPGAMVVTFEGYRYQVSLMAAAVAVVAVVAVAMLLWWLLKALWNGPHRVRRFFRARRRDRGYQSLSTGLIAAGAGDSGLARKMDAQARKLLRRDQEPLLHLLDAQAMLLEGDHEAARRKFEAMADDPETRLLGLRGLFLEAERLGDRRAARFYAARAAEIAPQLNWASEATIEEKVEAGDWDGALRLVEARKPDRAEDKERQIRLRSVLLTAKSMAVLDPDPTTARAAALEANRIRPDFAPAALAAARALFRLDDLRKGAKLLEAAWKLEAHPEVAEAYIHARPGDSTHDRLERAKRLRSMRMNNPQSSMAVARAALAAHEYGLAREAAEETLRMDPREGVYLFLADVAAAVGDEGRVREYLAKALLAAQDPAWVADGYVSDRWMPASPVTGRLDAFEWRVPVERLHHSPAIEAEAAAAHPALMPPVPVVEPEADPAWEEEPVVEPTEVVVVTAPEPIEEVAGTEPANGAAVEPEPDEDSIRPPPLPDDPGVDRPRDEEPRRFRLF
ncbi:MAG TPA: heme biosynthesis HemY N-terminal domain-containing protein [Mesorhizobium sp.]|jgi:HemY protein|nr:heme biosynthesis HemY N-terminal domain-containing protein [Mesorhizobium sp.]